MVVDQYSNGGPSTSLLAEWCSKYGTAMVRGLNRKPIDEGKNPNDLNTEQVCYSDPQCSYFLPSSLYFHNVYL